MERLRGLRLPSPAMTVACIALAVALSGASYAAIVLPKNSVGTKQLRKNAVTSAKVKNNAITGAKVNEATLGQVPSAANAEMLDGLDSSAFQRVFGGPRQLVVPAAAFVPLTDATEFERNVIYSGGIKPKALGSVVAPVQFPDGAVVTKVSWYHGAGPAEAGLLHLEANDINPAGGSHVDMVDLKSALCASQPCAPIVATTIASAAIDNVNTHYGLFLTDQSAAVDLVTWKVVIEYVLGPQAAALARTSQGGSGE